MGLSLDFPADITCMLRTAIGPRTGDNLPLERPQAQKKQRLIRGRGGLSQMLSCDATGRRPPEWNTTAWRRNRGERPLHHGAEIRHVPTAPNIRSALVEQQVIETSGAS